MYKKTILSALLSLLIVGTTTAQSVYDVTVFGAKGNGTTDDAAAIQRAIDQCSREGGGRVLFPRNHTFLAGPIELKSHVELYLEATAMLKANPDESIYHLSAFGENRGEGGSGPKMPRTSVLQARAPFMVTALPLWVQNWMTPMS